MYCMTLRYPLLDPWLRLVFIVVVSVISSISTSFAIQQVERLTVCVNNKKYDEIAENTDHEK